MIESKKGRAEKMAGLLAWAADVVRKTGASDDEQYDVALDSIPIIFTPEQQKYVRDLDQKANSLTRSIQDLRLRLPPPDISQRLPHLHAHSIASNADLALQLNAHSATKEQVTIFSNLGISSFCCWDSLFLLQLFLFFFMGFGSFWRMSGFEFEIN